MIRISMDKDRGDARLKTRWGNASREIVLASKRVMEAWGDRVRAQSIKNLLEKMTGKEHRLGTPLAETIQRSPATRAWSRVTVAISWGYYYGSVLEFGPKSMRTWVIKAKWAKALRWVLPGMGGVAYAKHITRRWDESQLRPHVMPAVESTKSEAVAELAKLVEAAL